MPSSSSSLSAQLAAHAASVPKACGWLVGIVPSSHDSANAPPPLALGALRCAAITSEGVPASWSDEAKAVQACLAPGLSAVGFYVACADENELSNYLRENAAHVNAVLTPSAREYAVFAAVDKASPNEDGSVSYFCGATDSITLTAMAQHGSSTGDDADGGEDDASAPASPPADAAAALGALAASHIALRANPLVPLHVRPGAWGTAHAEATDAALELLASSRTCFALAEARHVGVVAIADGPGRAAPLATGLCSALFSASGEDAAGFNADEGEGDDDDDDDGDEAGQKSGGKKGKKAGGGGKKGKKGGGKKGGGGGKKPGAANAAAADAADHDEVAGVQGAGSLSDGCPLHVQVLWPQCAPVSATPHEAPLLSVTPLPASSGLPTEVLLQLDVVVYCPLDAPLASALETLRAALGDQLQRLAAAQLAAAPDAAAAASHTASAYTFRLETQPYLHTMLYALPTGCEAAEAPTRPAREEAHRRLGLPMDRPLLRTCNALPAGSAGWGGGGGGVAPTPIPAAPRRPRGSWGVGRQERHG